MSEVISETMLTNSSSCFLTRSTRSITCALCSATAPCAAICSSSDRSAAVNLPFFLLSSCATPTTSPLAVLIGTQRMLRVTNPVRSSTLRLKRGSA